MEPMTERHCLEHKRPILFYCQNHAVCVCDSCITEKHQSHTLLSLDQAQATIKEDLKTDIERLQEEICSIKQDDLKRSEADLKAQVIELKRRLSKRYYDRKKQLEEDEEYILRLIDDEGLRTLSRIKSYSETLTREQERIILIDHDAQSLEQGDSLSFIQNSKPIVSRS
ncbi:tripartite motif-containing protein 29-like isoform X2 [Leucoraja erinacea]|uniref:tripartite motif-containing protein 29-like isoform X2 n=1 Tax=Leucoraja erinaceus TaxID=7782 RepID=UPI00245859A4|nr:tripartite motif-containing protein 29-like isoform X2 [Leucoraja erinacea]